MSYIFREKLIWTLVTILICLHCPLNSSFLSILVSTTWLSTILCTRRYITCHTCRQLQNVTSLPVCRAHLPLWMNHNFHNISIDNAYIYKRHYYLDSPIVLCFSDYNLLSSLCLCHRVLFSYLSSAWKCLQFFKKNSCNVHNFEMHIWIELLFSISELSARESFHQNLYQIHSILIFLSFV